MCWIANKEYTCYDAVSHKCGRVEEENPLIVGKKNYLPCLRAEKRGEDAECPNRETWGSFWDKQEIKCPDCRAKDRAQMPPPPAPEPVRRWSEEEKKSLRYSLSPRPLQLGGQYGSHGL